LKAAIISPTGLLRRYSAKSKYHLALAHLIEDGNDYTKFYQERIESGQFVILDNSVIELGHPVEYTDLHRAVKILNPTELVLCDFPKDPEQTYKWACHYGPQIKDEFPDMKLMAVPQWYGSKMVGNWLKSYDELSALEYVDTIGVPKFLGHDRPLVMAHLQEQRNPEVEHHLLGTYGNPAVEIATYSQYDWIRGIDSKAPVRYGQQGVLFHPMVGPLVEVRDRLAPMSFTDANDPWPIVCNFNCNVYLEWADPDPMGQVLQFG
jgi:hypothetical protein